MKHLLLLAFLLLFTACSSTNAPEPQPLTNLSGYWTGSLESTNCQPNGTGQFSLFLSGDPKNGYTGELYSSSKIPVQLEQSSSTVVLSDTANLSGYLLTMQLEETSRTLLQGTFTEVSVNGCSSSKTEGTVTLSK